MKNDDILDSLEEGTFPSGTGSIEIIEVAPNMKSVSIPKGTVAYTVTKPDGKTFDGFNTLKGVKKMKEFHERRGDQFHYDESRADISQPINYKSPFGSPGGCTKC